MERVAVYILSWTERLGETERIVHTVSEYKLRFTPDQAKEIPMVDVAFEILRAANTPFYYRDLMKEIAKFKGLTDNEAMDVIAQVYTEINIDGRFACVGTNLWGLKRWYPVEKGDEAVSGGTKRPRIINDEDDDDDDLYVEEEEETYDAEAETEDFDTVDEDREEFVEEEEEEVDEEIADEADDEEELNEASDGDADEDVEEDNDDLDEDDK
jgi:DNA-directed RNA polymerase subunit delta